MTHDPLAMDPAVSDLHRRFGWRCGAATGLVFAGRSWCVAVTFVVLIPGLVDATNQIRGKVPDWINQVESTLGIRSTAASRPLRSRRTSAPVCRTGSATTPRRSSERAVTC